MAYAFAVTEGMAKAQGLSLPVSTKHCVMICTFLRGKEVVKAKAMLSRVLEKKQAVPFTRFNRDRGHKPGMAAGRFPIKAAAEILKVIENAEANAQSKGLGNLVIVHICANRASRPRRYGRKGGVKSKRSHVEIVVAEGKKEEKKVSKAEDKK